MPRRVFFHVSDQITPGEIDAQLMRQTQITLLNYESMILISVQENREYFC